MDEARYILKVTGFQPPVNQRGYAMTPDSSAPPPNRAMSAQDLAVWGVEDVAYIKRVVINHEIGWSIHGADGQTIGLAHNRDQAFAAVRQNELCPVSVH